MSLILEALKKSERQRRLGEMPNLGTPVLTARRRRSLLPWLAGAIAVALAVGAWLRFAPPPQSITPPPAEATVSVPAVSAPPSIAPPPTSVPAAPTVAPPASTVARAKPTSPPATPDIPLPSGDDRPGSVADGPLSPLVAGPRKPPATAPAAVAPATRPALATQPAKPAVAPAAAVTPKSPAATATGAPATASTPVQPAPRKPVAPAVPDLPSVWEMPYAVRKDLPALALTMHVYSSVPAERFVVIEGERHVEGDDLGDGVILREIRGDGIVLDFKGQRFVYPRDGR